MKCYICEINDSTPLSVSDEHIIPKVIGGRLRAPILCRKHNSDAGKNIDNSLIEIFQPFRVFLGLVESEPKSKPKRWNSFAVKMSTTGDDFLIDAYGDAFLADPSISFTEITDQLKQFQIQASTNEELELILSGIKKKFPKIERKDIIPIAKPKKENATYNASLLLSSEQIKKAIAKVAVGFAYSKGIEASQMFEAIQYLSNEKDGHFVSHLNDFITDRHRKNCFNHTLVLNGSPETGLLVCFIELFACAPFIVLLKRGYEGPAITFTHSIDPTNSDNFIADASVDLNEEFLNNVFIHDDLVPAGFIDCFKRGLALASGYQRMRREISFKMDEGRAVLGLSKYDLDQNDLMRLMDWMIENYFKFKSRRP